MTWLVLLLALQDEMAPDVRRAGDRVAASVVRIEHGEGHGTGFLVDPRGYVLTNAHVSFSPLPSVVQVAHPESGGFVTKTYTKVLLAGFHPTLDLALLRIDPAEHGRPLPALRLAETAPARGSRIFAMGFPAVLDGGRKKTISHGRLTGLDRVIYRHTYVETDAPVAPGNSGGPLFLESGEVIGVVTLQRSPDGTAMALPVWSLPLGSFVPLHQRPKDAAAAVEILREAEKSFERGRRGDVYALELGLALYQEAAIVDVGNPEIFRKLGIAYGLVGRPRTSAAYLARVLQISPWPPHGASTYAALAEALGPGRADASFAVLQEGLWKHPDEAARLLAPLSRAAAAAGRPLDGAFYAHLGGIADRARALRERLSPDDRSMLDRREASGEAWLELRRREAVVARRVGRAALTPEFEIFMRTFDGVQREGATADLTRFDGSAVRAEADRLSTDEVTRIFLRAQLKTAATHLDKGRRELGEAILREIIQDHPGSPEAREARLLLD